MMKVLASHQNAFYDMCIFSCQEKIDVESGYNRCEKSMEANIMKCMNFVFFAKIYNLTKANTVDFLSSAIAYNF